MKLALPFRISISLCVIQGSELLRGRKLNALQTRDTSGFNVEANVQPQTCTGSMSAALTWNNFNSFKAPSCLHHSLTARNNNVESSRCGETHRRGFCCIHFKTSHPHLYIQTGKERKKERKLIHPSIHPPPRSPLTGLERLETVPAAIG